MRKLAAILTSFAFAGAGMIAPALATTDSTSTNGDYATHAVDCLVLMFTNPAERAAKCGTPDALPPPPNGSTGFKACNVGEIDPFGIDGVQFQVAGPISCCFSSLVPSLWQGAPGRRSLIWDLPASRVTLAAC